MLNAANSPSIPATKDSNAHEIETSAKPPRRVTKKTSGPEDRVVRKTTASFLSPSMRADQARGNNESSEGIDLTKSALPLGPHAL